MAYTHPPPLVALNREGRLAELYYSVASSVPLDDAALGCVAELLIPATIRAAIPPGLTRVVIMPSAGYALVPAGEADQLRDNLSRILAGMTTEGERR